MKIDIVTGFLGAGKTTFIYGYGKYLNEIGERVLVIENEFGLAGVDGKLLKGQQLEVIEIAGGCVCCTQKTNLMLFLGEAYEHGYDRVILEPSGIYNLDTFFDLMESPELKYKCELNGVITIVKPDFMQYSTGEYRNIFMSQFLSTGAIVFSNTQSYKEDEISDSFLKLCNFAKENNPNFSISDITVYTKDWSDFSKTDYIALSQSGRTFCEHKMIVENHAGFVENTFFLAKLKSYDNINELLDFIFDKGGSEILRIKGFVMVGEPDSLNGYSLNCTSNCRTIEPSENKHAVLNVIGLKLNLDEIDKKMKMLSI